MPMKNPPQPGGFVLTECIEPLGLTVETAAQAMGVSFESLSDLVSERTSITPEMAVRLSKVFGGRADTWLLQQAHYDLAQIPAETLELARLRMA